MTRSTVWAAAPDYWLPAEPTELTHFDDIIIGAGVVGLTAAISLATQGRAVAVVEAMPTVGYGTTGRSTGKLSLLQGTRLSTIARRHGLDTARRYLDGCQDALDWVGPILQRHEVQTEKSIAFTWAEFGDHEQSVADEHAITRRLGLATELSDRPPYGLPGTSTVALDGQLQVDPLQYVRALAREASAVGVEFHLGQRIQHVRAHRHVTTVSTGDGLELSADHVVVATGLPITDRNASFATTHPHRSYIVAFAHDGPIEMMAVTAGSPTISVRGLCVDSGDAVLVGGHEHTVGRGGRTVRHLDALRGWAHEHLDVDHELASWSAHDQMTPDELPVVGRAPASSTINVATGLGGWGLLAGVAVARRIAAAVHRGESLPITPPVRLLHPASASSIVQRNAVVASDLVSGWANAVRTSGEPADGVGVVQRGLPPRAVSSIDGCRRSVSGVCTHLGGIVSWNEVERSWDCPLHGSRFDVDGQVLDGPATRALRRLADNSTDDD